MRSQLDVTADALYVHVTDVPIDHTEELEDGTIVDVGSGGELVGIEVLSVSRGWQPDLVAARFELSPFDQSALFAIAHPPAAMRVGGVPSQDARDEHPTAAGSHTVVTAGV
jgi:uncharacterized protein YuzE